MSELNHWTLQRIRSVISRLSQIENSVGDLLEPSAPLMSRMRSFSPSHDIARLERLNLSGKVSPPLGILQALAPYFWAGLLIEKHPEDEEALWWLTGFVARGEYFEIDLADRLDCEGLMTPLQSDEVRRASADAVLTRLPLPMTPPPPDTFAYVMTPRPGLSYIWFSASPPLFSEQFMRKTLDLIHDAIETP